VVMSDMNRILKFYFLKLPSFHEGLTLPPQPIFIRIKSGHCLGKYRAVKLSLSPVINVVSLSTPTSFSTSSPSFYSHFKKLYKMRGLQTYRFSSHHRTLNENVRISSLLCQATTYSNYYSTNQNLKRSRSF
jgi:hypothetical protein